MRFQFNPFTDKLDISGTGPGATSVDFVTGNSGGPVSADAAFNINIVGDNVSGLNTIGNLAPNTLTIFGLSPSTTQRGTTRYATNAEAAAQTIGTAALTPANITSLFSVTPLPTAQGGTGLSSPAAHQLIVTNGSSPFTLLGVASNGQIPIGSIGSNPVLGNITSSGGTITVTNGPGTINLEASGTGDVQTLTGNTGGVISPTLGNINTVGTGSITIAGAGSTLTTQLTGLTNHNVLVGAGSSTITNVAPSTSGFVLTSNGASADPSFQAVSASGAITTITGNSGGAESPSAGNFNIVGTGSITVAGTANTETIQLTGLTNHSLLVGAGTATITNLGVATNGQLPIGSTGADPVLATLTAGNGIGITNAAGSITIATAGGGFTWTTVTGTTQAAAINNGYIANNAGLVTITLPAVSAVGDQLYVTGINNATGWKIAQNAGNQIFMGAAASTSGTGGFISSLATRDSVHLVCVTANAAWNVIGAIGNITVT